MKNKAVIFMMSMVLAMGECSASPCRYRFRRTRILQKMDREFLSMRMAW